MAIAGVLTLTGAAIAAVGINAWRNRNTEKKHHKLK